MRDDEERPPRGFRVDEERVEQARGGGGVEACRRLVEQEDRLVARERESGEQAAALAAGEMAGIGAERRVDAAREGADDVLQASCAECRADVRRGCVRAVAAEVLADGAAKEHGALRQRGDGACDGGGRQRRVGGASESKRTVHGRPDAEQEQGKRRLARATRADDGCVFAAPQCEGEIREDGRAAGIGEGEVRGAQQDGAACPLCCGGCWLAAGRPLCRGFRGIRQQAACSGEALPQLAHGVRQCAPGTEEGLQYEQEDGERDA